MGGLTEWKCPSWLNFEFVKSPVASGAMLRLFSCPASSARGSQKGCYDGAR